MSQPVFIDVRQPEEFATGHVEGAVNIPLPDLASSAKLHDIPKDAELVVYCRSGARADTARRLLTQMGYTNVTNGINAQSTQQRFGV